MIRAANIARSWHKVRDAQEAGEGSSGPLNPSGFEEMLRARALLSDDALQRALLVHAQTGERLDAVVTRLGLLSEDRVATEMGAYTGLPVVDGSAFPSQAIEGPDLPPDFLRENRAVPIAADTTLVRVPVRDPFDSFVEQAFGFTFGRHVERVIARASDLDAAIERLYHGAGPVAEDADGEIDSDDLERLKDLVSDAPVIRAVNRLIARASDERASDIHIEPSDDGLSVRFRVDGMLREAAGAAQQCSAPPSP